MSAVATMAPVALWLPFELATGPAALDRAVGFYTERLGLSKVDEWARDGEHGVVLGVPGPAYVELVRPAPGAPPGPRVAFALELAGAPAVDHAYADLTADRPPARFPRGHYGFTMPDPAGLPILLWSER